MAKKKKKSAPSKRPDIVQWYNKETDRYVKYERATATVISEKVTPGPYKNIHIVKRRPAVRKRKIKSHPKAKKSRVTKKQAYDAARVKKVSKKKKTKKKKAVKASKKKSKKKAAKKASPQPTPVEPSKTKKKTTKKKVKKKKKVNYLNNKDMLAEVMKSKEQGSMTDKLAHMLQTLAARYGRKGNFANYTYNEDMQAYAMLMLVKTWNSFNPEKSKNPFAFFTQCIKNSFIQFLNQEKRQRDIRDAQLVDKGLTPSYTYQMEHEARMRAHREVDHHDQHIDDGDDHPVEKKEEEENLLTY